MEREAVSKIIRANQHELAEMGVKSIAIFGSVSRGDATEKSDIDILIDLKIPTTFDNYMDIKILLEDLLGEKVDLVVESMLRPRVKPFVEQDAFYVA